MWIRNNVNVYNHWEGGALVPRAGVQRGSLAGPSGGRPDMYAGRDGQVYQHNQKGWSTPNSNGQWQKVPANPGLEQEQRQSRSFGQTRQNEFQQRGVTPGIPRSVAPSGRGFGEFSGGGRHR